MLDAKFYDTLSRLTLRMSHKSSLNMSGNRKSVQKGISAEFSDFREYMPGDDIRRMDWNVYARLDKLYIREYMEEKEAVVSVLVDTSASMDYGTDSKSELAKDLAAVVGFLALNNMDRLILYDMRDMGRGLSVNGGKNAFPKVLHWLERLEFAGEADMLAAARRVRYRGPGVTVIISDFLHADMLDETAAGYEKLLQYLNFCKQRPVILHTMAAEELRITLEGALNLIDSETEDKLRLTVDAAAIDSYERELNRLIGRMKKGCSAGSGAYVLCDSGKDRNQLVFNDLKGSMIFESLWPLALLLAVPVVIILYLLKPKGKDYKISSNLLWDKLFKNQQSKTFLEKFIHNILMYLQLLIILLLVLALMSPYIHREGRSRGNVILVMDTSGSMQHDAGNGRMRIEEAVAEAKSLIASSDETAFSILTNDCTGTNLLAVGAKDKNSLYAALDQVECCDGAGNLPDAESVVETLRGANEEDADTEVIVFTDGNGAQDAMSYADYFDAQVLVMGEAVSNVANNFLSYVEETSEENVPEETARRISCASSLTNYSDAEASVEVSLYAGTQLVQVTQATVAANETTLCFFDAFEWNGEPLRSGSEPCGLREMARAIPWRRITWPMRL